MASSIWKSVYLKIFVLTITFALVFYTIYFAYYKDQLSTFDFSMNTKTSTVNYEKPREGRDDILILIWVWPYSSVFFDLNCAPFNMTGCILTSNHALYYAADAVMIHHWDTIFTAGFKMPKEPRPYFQKWIWWTIESPTIHPSNPNTTNSYNLTANYRRDSDVFTPYGTLAPISNEDSNFSIPLKERLVCWIVTHWKPTLERVPYYNELKKHIKIDTYGRAFGKEIGGDQYVEIMKSCKFYLAFEYAIHDDYITEKFFRSLELGAVPVVLGPSRENYESHAPGNSFIHVNDFDSPKELAEKLKYLDQHQDEYMSYFEWKNQFKVVHMRFGQEHACRTCEYMKKYRRYQHVRNLNKWYWND